MSVTKLTDDVPLDAPKAGVRRLPDDAVLDDRPSFAAGVGTGVMDKVLGAAQFGARGVTDPPPIAYTAEQAAAVAPERRQEQIAGVDQGMRDREKQLQAEGYNKGWGRTVGNVVGDIAITAPLSLIPGGAGASLGARVAQGAGLGAAGGAIGGATTPATGDNFAKEKIEQIVGGAAEGGVAGGILGGLSKAIASKNPAEVDTFIRRNFERAVKPSISGKSSAGQLARSQEQAANAISSIAANKANLSFTDDAGEKIVGQLPKTIEQFGEAIAQTKRSIFAKYDAMAKQSGTLGAEISERPIVEELEKVAADRTMREFHPDLVAYAESLAQRITAGGSYTATQAQDVIQNLNASIKNFYRNPTYETTTHAAVIDMIANKMRKGLDEAVENTVGPGYQALKNEYGALSSIEKAVVNRAVVDGRKNLGGGILGRIGDIASAEELIRGVVTLNPKAVAIGTGIKAGVSFMNWLRSPNRAISRLFDAADQKLTAPTEPVGRPVMSYIAPGVGASTAEATNRLLGLQ